MVAQMLLILQKEEKMAANDRITNMSVEMRCLKKLEQKGFLSQFRVIIKFQLQCIQTGRCYNPEDILVVNFYRFEGISDPDDMSIIYAIITSGGQKGTLIDAFGIYANDNVGEFFNAVKNIRKQTKRGWHLCRKIEHT